MATALALGAASCDGGASLGEPCASPGDCAGGLQCLAQVCVPSCERQADCGDGHVCEADGRCVRVDSDLGDTCARERDCGPGQACVLATADFNADGALTASCQLEVDGGVLDDACTSDGDCRTGTCALGRCVDVCADDLDCPSSHVCSSIPRALAVPDRVASFAGCLPARGALRFRIPMTSSYARFWLPVPGAARSVALVARVDDPTQLVGAARLEAPGGELLYRTPQTRDEFFANAVRFAPARGVSTLVLPQSPELPLVPGGYAVELGSYLEPGVPGTEIPQVEVLFKLDDAVELVPHFYFLDLDDHPCGTAFDDGVLDAASAAAEGSTFRTAFLRELSVIFARAGVLVDVREATFTDVRDRPDLDGLDASQLGALLERSAPAGGAHVFFVRSIAPAGLLALVGGPPGTPRTGGTRASGVVIAADALCYRSWSALARNAAHELARSLGLQRSVEPDGYEDSIADTDVGPGNLMYFGELTGDGATADDELTPGQRAILRAAPGVGGP